jgi:DNA polymerase (family 10)
MTNYEIADHFSLLSKLMDIHGEDSFKAKSYGSAAFNIEKSPVELSTLNPQDLFNVKGIGKTTGAKVLELLETGKLTVLENLIAQTPPGIIEMMNIKGLGPKKIATIWHELGIETLGELEYACMENRLVTAKGFGAKTQESVLQSLLYFKQNQGFHLWAEVEQSALLMLKKLQEAFAHNKVALSGPYRRQAETLEMIDFVCDLNEKEIEEFFGQIEGVIIEKPEVKLMKVQLPGTVLFSFHLCARREFYSTLFMTSGSAEFIEAFCKAYTVPLHAESEEAIFALNNLPFIPAAQREGSEIEKLAHRVKGQVLIMPADIKGIIHSHSKWSDGAETIEDMAKAAKEKGFEYLVISDHSQAAFYAKGLSPESISAQHAEIDALNIKLAPFKIFKSIEADILNDGQLDYNAKVLNTFDLVIASVHSNLKMNEEKAMMRVMNAIKNPFTTILGHPSGRLLLSRRGYPLDYKQIIDACAAHHVVIELNAHPRRLDLDWRWIEYAMEKKVLLSIDPDAHAIAGYHDVYYGVMAAQKGGLCAKNNLSSYSLKDFELFLEKYRAKKA